MPTRSASTFALPQQDDHKRPSFLLEHTKDAYTRQYANLYWLRLVVLRPRVEARAAAKWATKGGNYTQDGRVPSLVKRVLDVERNKICFVIGTVYTEMALKPNVLEDLARENYVAAPPARRKFCSEGDEIMLEDESGRVRLTGDAITENAGTFVTGTIMAALGAETPTGDFEVFELLYAGLPPQPKPTPTPTTAEGEWVALISGLQLGGSEAAELKGALLAEWLTGELGDDEDGREAVRVTRLILAGNSLAQPAADEADEKKPTRYGYDSTLFSSEPTAALDSFLEMVLPSLAVDLMPGELDPSAPTMPQQPLHAAILPKAATYEGYASRTNPYWCEIGGAGFLGTSGQPLDDIFKYLTSEDRLAMAHRTLEWSHLAPTCPDTLWCFPFSERDPFILHETPRVYFVGSQPEFQARTVRGGDGQACTIVLLPAFEATGEVVLVNSATGETRVVRFEVGL